MSDAEFDGIAETEPAKQQHAFPCQQCGAQLQYREGTQLLACNHCGHEHQIVLSREPILEYDFHSTLNSLPGSAPDTVQLTVKCHACAAEFEFDPNLHADECPFCGTRIVVDAHQHRQIQPKALLPFRINAGQARDAYKSWLGRLWFAPNAVKKYARQQRDLNGVYVPYWTYDCATFTRYQGQRGDVYQVRQRVRVKVNGRWTTQMRTVNKIRWTPTSGSVDRDFDDVLVYATDSLPRSMAKELAPWDLPALQPFQDEFLSGFQSEVYKLDLAPGFEEAKHRMHPAIRQDIRRDIGGDQQRITASDTRYSEITFKHILLPFWIAGFRFRNKTYQFIVNARSGEVQGDRPWSVWKIGFAVLIGASIAATLGYFYLQGQAGGANSFNIPGFESSWGTFNYQ